MKWSYTSGITIIELACVVVIVLLSIHFVAVLAKDSDPTRIQPDDSNAAGRFDIRPAELTYDLPKGWQAEWRGEMLWIAHYNPNGTVADSLSFISYEDLYDWVKNHPDFCDVDVEKISPVMP